MVTKTRATRSLAHDAAPAERQEPRMRVGKPGRSGPTCEGAGLVIAGPAQMRTKMLRPQRTSSLTFLAPLQVVSAQLSEFWSCLLPQTPA